MTNPKEKSLSTTYFLQHFREFEWDKSDLSAQESQIKAAYELFVMSLKKHVNSTRSGFVKDTLRMGLVAIEEDLNEADIRAEENISDSEQNAMIIVLRSMYVLSEAESRFDVLVIDDDD